MNDKKYVGKTTYNNVNKRFREHLCDSRKDTEKNRPLYSAIRKHGEGSFSISVIEECTAEEAAEREVFWIKAHDTYRNGYNATLGGDGKLRIDHSKMRALLQDGADTKDICEELGCSKDTVWSAARSVGLDRRYKTNECSMKGVLMLSKEGDVLMRFDSGSAAGSYLGNSCKRNHILECARGERKSAYGYMWRFV